MTNCTCAPVHGHHSAVPRISDVKHSAILVEAHFTRIPQTSSWWHELGYPNRVQRKFLVVVSDSPIHKMHQLFQVGLPHDVVQQRTPAGAKHDHRGPTLDPEALPQLDTGVVHDGVRDGVPPHGVAHALRELLVLELGRVHAYHRDTARVRMRRLDACQRRKDVDAVDAAVGEEVEDDDLAPELLVVAQGLGDVEPLRPPGKVRVDLKERVVFDRAYVVRDHLFPLGFVLGCPNGIIKGQQLRPYALAL